MPLVHLVAFSLDHFISREHVSAWSWGLPVVVRRLFIGLAMLCGVVSLSHSGINQMISDLFGAYLYIGGDSRIRSGCNCSLNSDGWAVCNGSCTTLVLLDYLNSKRGQMSELAWLLALGKVKCFNLLFL